MRTFNQLEEASTPRVLMCGWKEEGRKNIGLMRRMGVMVDKKNRNDDDDGEKEEEDDDDDDDDEDEDEEEEDWSKHHYTVRSCGAATTCAHTAWCPSPGAERGAGSWSPLWRKPGGWWIRLGAWMHGCMDG